jgi:uncharacterized protein (DUF608 family)
VHGLAFNFIVAAAGQLELQSSARRISVTFTVSYSRTLKKRRFITYFSGPIAVNPDATAVVLTKGRVETAGLGVDIKATIPAAPYQKKL